MDFNDLDIDSLSYEELSELYNDIVEDPNSEMLIAHCCRSPGSGHSFDSAYCSGDYCQCWWRRTQMFDNYCRK